MDFLLVIIHFFSLNVRAEIDTTANIDWKSPFFLQEVGHFDRNFHVEGYVCHQPFVHR